MNIQFTIQEIDAVAKQILNEFPLQKCIAFYADMGSGKTTLINALCKQIGVVENTSSPTFSIINEYEIANTKQPVYHMDWYRLKNTDEAIEVGVQDILDKKENYIFIEWPEIAEELLPTNCLHLKIELLPNLNRKISIL